VTRRATASGACLSQPGGFFPSGVHLKRMKILVQDRQTNAFLTRDKRWVRQLDYACTFSTSLEALRFCHDTKLTNMDVLVCYPGTKTNLRLPLC
jgi:hypothetical protein